MSDALLVPREADWSFVPDAARAVDLDRTVRRRLAESLQHLQNAIAPSGDNDKAFERCIKLLDIGPVRPTLFAVYTDLVEAIAAQDEGKFRSALQALGEIMPSADSHVRALTLIDDDLGPGMAERFRRHIDNDPAQRLAIAPVASADLSDAQRWLDATLHLIDEACPELAGEIRVFAHEVIFVASRPQAGQTALESASTFYLWGALFLNATIFSDRIAMAEALSHECAHCLLHAFTLAQPLVENDAAEQYPSPLRRDARPMEGVVHATYVLARMHYCIERLLGSGLLDAEERIRAAAARTDHARGFADGLAIVDTHARFTQKGTAIFASARDHMRGRVAMDPAL